MSENDEFEENSETESESSDVSRDRYRLWIWALVIGNTLAVIGIWCIAHQTADWNSWANVVAVAVLGLASFDVATISALTSREMIETMKGQEGEMRLQRQTTQKQLTAMNGGLTETKNIINQNERTIKASQRQARSSEAMVKTTQEMFYLSERAYIGIAAMYPEPAPIVKGQLFRVWCHIVNTGKTPATDLEHMLGIGFEPIGQEYIRPVLPDATQSGADKDLLAGMSTYLRGLWMNISDEEFERIHVLNTMKLVVFGKIKYQCIQNRQEIHRFEYTYDVESESFIRLGGTINGKTVVDTRGGKDYGN
jgi:hypothetical protein